MLLLFLNCGSLQQDDNDDILTMRERQSRTRSVPPILIDLYFMQSLVSYVEHNDFTYW